MTSAAAVQTTTPPNATSKTGRTVSAVGWGLLASWLVGGAGRFLAIVHLNAYLEHRLGRLTLLALREAWLAPTFFALVLVAGLLAWALSWTLARGLRPSRGGTLLASVLPLGLFWLAFAIHEIAVWTRYLDVMKGGFKPSPAHLWILGLSLFGALLAWLLTRRLEERDGKSKRHIVGALLFALIVAGGGWAGSARPSSENSKRLNVLLITVDTLRVDHLSSYSYERRTTPHLDALAAAGTRFTRSISQAPHTHPAMASMLTSAYPTQLGGELKYIPYDLPTVAEVFRNAGYQTAAVSSNVWIKSALGFDQGFEHFDQTSAMNEFYADDERRGWKDASDVSQAGLAWLDKHQGEPFFLWLHYLDPHHPYEPAAAFDQVFANKERPKPPFLDELRRLSTAEQTRRLLQLADASSATAAEDFRALLDLYDGEIAQTDAQIGRVLTRLDELGLDQRTAIVFTADHGEEFLDHDSWGHSHTLYDELIHVPLILHRPGQEDPGAVRDELVRTLDIAPTLLALCGLETPRSMRGRNLLSRRGSKDPPAISILTRSKQFSIEIDGWKLIHAVKTGASQLFELTTDPHEKIDRAASEPDRVRLMLALFDKTLGDLPWSGKTEVRDHMLDRETLEQLKALGYVQ